MDDRPLATQIKELAHDDEAGLEELGRDAREQSFSISREALQIWMSDDVGARGQAETILDALEELAIRPLAQISDDLEPNDRAWQLDTIVNAELRLRSRVLQILEQAMDEIVPIPELNPGGPIEEPIPPRRVRDHAYLLARQLTANESVDRQVFNEDAFLQMDMEERDAEVERFRKSREWVDLVEDLDEFIDR